MSQSSHVYICGLLDFSLEIQRLIFPSHIGLVRLGYVAVFGALSYRFYFALFWLEHFNNRRLNELERSTLRFALFVTCLIVIKYLVRLISWLCLVMHVVFRRHHSSDQGPIFKSALFAARLTVTGFMPVNQRVCRGFFVVIWPRFLGFILRLQLRRVTLLGGSRPKPPIWWLYRCFKRRTGRRLNVLPVRFNAIAILCARNNNNK